MRLKEELKSNCDNLINDYYKKKKDTWDKIVMVPEKYRYTEAI